MKRYEPLTVNPDAEIEGGLPSYRENGFLVVRQFLDDESHRRVERGVKYSLIGRFPNVFSLSLTLNQVGSSWQKPVTSFQRLYRPAVFGVVDAAREFVVDVADSFQVATPEE